MARIRLFILLTVSFLIASAALADDLGYVDCASHPESAQVFSKARQTPDSLGTVACGERFTVLVYGFVFSRVQTKDGKVGYIYSNLITVDRGAPAPMVPNAPGAVPVKPVVANASVNAPAYAQPTSAQAASMPVTTSAPPQKPAAQSGPLFPTPPMPAVTAADMATSSAKSASVSSASAQPASSPAPAASLQPAAPAASQPATPAPVETKPASAPSPAPVTPSASPSASASTPAASTPASAPAPSAQPTAPAPSQPSAPASAETQPAAQSTPAQSSAPAQPGPLFPTPPPPPPSSSDSTASAAVEPAPAASSQPQPDASQPAAEPVKSATARSSWEQPTAGVHQNFLVQLYGGYAFDRFTSGGVATNLSGGLGSFGYNLKPWLQIVGDTSYSYVTGTGVKNVLYGNHFGGRYFYHPGRWRVTPFVEALVGGSRFDITVSGPGGYKASQNCISYKAGGGLDFRVSRRWEVRVIDVDYYRTSFGAGSYPSQTNYWASAGVVMRLFGSGASE